MDVGIYIELSRFLENIISSECFVDVRATFRYKMAAANDVVNGNNFGVALVMTSAAFDDVHASCLVRETEWCKPFDVWKWTGKVQAKLGWKVENDTNLRRTKTCILFSIASLAV